MVRSLPQQKKKLKSLTKISRIMPRIELYGICGVAMAAGGGTFRYYNSCGKGLGTRFWFDTRSSAWTSADMSVLQALLSYSVNVLIEPILSFPPA